MNMHMVVKRKRGHVWYVCDSGSFHDSNRGPFDLTAKKANAMSEQLEFDVKEYAERKDPPKHIATEMRIVFDAISEELLREL